MLAEARKLQLGNCLGELATELQAQSLGIERPAFASNVVQQTFDINLRIEDCTHHPAPFVAVRAMELRTIRELRSSTESNDSQNRPHSGPPTMAHRKPGKAAHRDLPPWSKTDKALKVMACLSPLKVVKVLSDNQKLPEKAVLKFRKFKPGFSISS